MSIYTRSLTISSDLQLARASNVPSLPSFPNVEFEIKGKKNAICTRGSADGQSQPFAPIRSVPSWTDGRARVELFIDPSSRSGRSVAAFCEYIRVPVFQRKIQWPDSRSCNQDRVSMSGMAIVSCHVRPVGERAPNTLVNTFQICGA